MAATLEQSDDRHIWTLSDHSVTQLCVEPSSCRLQSWSLRESLEIRFGAPFELALADGWIREIDPEAHEQLAPLLTMIGRSLEQLTIARAGTLELRLSDASIISAESHHKREAFTVIGAGALEGMSYVAVPGARAIW